MFAKPFRGLFLGRMKTLEIIISQPSFYGGLVFRFELQFVLNREKRGPTVNERSGSLIPDIACSVAPLGQTLPVHVLRRRRSFIDRNHFGDICDHRLVENPLFGNRGYLAMVGDHKDGMKKNGFSVISVTCKAWNSGLVTFLLEVEQFKEISSQNSQISEWLFSKISLKYLESGGFRGFPFIVPDQCTRGNYADFSTGMGLSTTQKASL